MPASIRGEQRQATDHQSLTHQTKTSKERWTTLSGGIRIVPTVPKGSIFYLGIYSESGGQIMITNQAYEYEAEKLLYQFYHEIALLKNRVEAASPCVRGNCEEQLRALLEQYKLAEAHVQAIRAARDGVQTELGPVSDCLQELHYLLASVGRWIWVQTAG
jgi:hypothetical protein